MTLKFIPKIAMTIAKLAAAHPIAAAAIAGAGLFVAGAVIPKLMPGTVDEQERKTAAAPGTNAEKIKKLEEQKANLNFLQRMQGVGAEIDEQIKFLETGQTAAYSGGGLVQGFSGGGMARGTDTVPAMLTPGEFVMSRGAVNKYGVDTLASMNAAGGGTNRPRMIGGSVYASGGGHVHAGPDTQPAEENRQSKEKQPEVPVDSGEPNRDDFAMGRAGGKAYSEAMKKYKSSQPASAVNRSTDESTTETTETKQTPLQLSGKSKELVGGDKAFLSKVTEVSNKFGANPADLLGLMASESGLDPQAVNSKSGATGLIQFMPDTAKGLGTSTSALLGMDRVQQMKYVEAFMDKFTPMNPTAGHLYTSIFLPAFAKKDADFVIATQDGSLPKGYESQSPKWYSGNSGLDANNDKKITIAEMGGRIAAKQKAFGISGGSATPVDSIARSENNSSSGGNTGDGGGGGGESKPFDKSLLATFDYNKIRQQLGVKTSSVSKPSRPSSSTAAYNQMQQQNQQQGQQQAEQSQTADIPAFDAAAMSSPRKIKTLGITV